MSETFKFYTRLRVRFNETDRQGHVNFGHYYFYFDEAITSYLEAIGYNYEVMAAEQTELLFAESHCNYKSSARWPEWLRVYVRVVYLGQRSLRFELEVRAEADDRLIATGHIVAVTANKNTFEPQPISARLRGVISAHEEGLAPAPSDQSQDNAEDVVIEADLESFPASDPPAWTLGREEES